MINSTISNIEAEKYFLLACMNLENYNDILAEAPSNMADMFDRQDHRILYRAITEVSKAGVRPEPVTIAVWLMNNNLNDKVDGHLLMLTDHRTSEKIPTFTKEQEVKYYIETIKNCYANRQILAICQQTMQDIHNGAYAYEVIANLSKSIGNILAMDIGKESKESNMIIADLIDSMEQGTNVNKGLVFGYPKTFYQMLGGLQAGQIMTIGARTSVGKSLVICNIMRNISLRKKKVLYFDLEMTDYDFASRLLSAQARVNTSYFKHNRETLAKIGKTDIIDKLKKAQAELAEGEPIERYDMTNLNIEQVCTKIKASHMKKPVSLVVIDHVGLVRASSKGEPPRITISATMKAMKAIAKELGIAVIVGSQINRAGTDYPQLEYLKESGSIEEDSDIVALLHRPTDSELNEDNKHNLEVFFAKNRAGRKGIVTMYVDFGCQLMLDGYMGKPKVGAFQSEAIDKKAPEAKEAKSLFAKK